jgi:hypothetical protein
MQCNYNAPQESAFSWQIQQEEADRKKSSACCLLLAGYMLGLVFNPEDGGTVFLQNISKLLPHYIPKDISTACKGNNNVRACYLHYINIIFTYMYRTAGLLATVVCEAIIKILSSNVA